MGLRSIPSFILNAGGLDTSQLPERSCNSQQPFMSTGFTVAPLVNGQRHLASIDQNAILTTRLRQHFPLAGESGAKAQS
jgi:hypothetical protein